MIHVIVHFQSQFAPCSGIGSFCATRPARPALAAGFVAPARASKARFCLVMRLGRAAERPGASVRTLRRFGTRVAANVASQQQQPQEEQLHQQQPQQQPQQQEQQSEEQSAGSCVVKYRGKEFRVARGTKLRTALLMNGSSPHNGRAQLINCRGLGTCGTCAVEVSRGDVAPSAWTTAERLRLNFPPHSAPNNQRLRLACQVSCQGPDLVVAKYSRFWGQGDDVLGPAADDEFRLPLGQLEFLLDQGVKPRD